MRLGRQMPSSGTVLILGSKSLPFCMGNHLFDPDKAHKDVLVSTPVRKVITAAKLQAMKKPPLSDTWKADAIQRYSADPRLKKLAVLHG
jgi:hypothetical protein